jgi:hypothetical protein
MSTYRSTTANINQTLAIPFVPAEFKIGGDIATELILEFADNVLVGELCVLTLLVVR